MKFVLNSFYFVLLVASALPAHADWTMEDLSKREVTIRNSTKWDHAPNEITMSHKSTLVSEGNTLIMGFRSWDHSYPELSCHYEDTAIGYGLWSSSTTCTDSTGKGGSTTDIYRDDSLVVENRDGEYKGDDDIPPDVKAHMGITESTNFSSYMMTEIRKYVATDGITRCIQPQIEAYQVIPKIEGKPNIFESLAPRMMKPGDTIKITSNSGPLRQWRKSENVVVGWKTHFFECTMPEKKIKKFGY